MLLPLLILHSSLQLIVISSMVFIAFKTLFIALLSHDSLFKYHIHSPSVIDYATRSPQSWFHRSQLVRSPTARKFCFILFSNGVSYRSVKYFLRAPSFHKHMLHFSYLHLSVKFLCYTFSSATSSLLFFLFEVNYC